MHTLHYILSFSKILVLLWQELPKGKWFCSANCKWIYSALQNVLNAGAEKLPDSTVDIITKKQTYSGTNLDVRWRLLNGKIASRETRVLLSQAVAIFHVRICTWCSVMVNFGIWYTMCTFWVVMIKILCLQSSCFPDVRNYGKVLIDAAVY